MKFFIVLAICVASASAQAIVAGVANTGASAVSRSEDGLGNYAFGYNEDHAFGGTFRKEKGGPGVQVGSYGLREADGRMRVVNYVADALGFRASVATNEPGTDSKQDPAAVSMNSGHIAAPLAVAAPAIAAAPFAMAAGTPVVAKAFGNPLMADLAIAKRFDGAPLIARGFDGGLIAKTMVAPITAHSFHTATQHISASPLIAKAGIVSPFAKTFVL